MKRSLILRNLRQQKQLARRKGLILGGGFNNAILPADVANIGRSFVSSVQNVGNTFMAKGAGTDPSPTGGQLTGTTNYNSLKILK
jgi:hypothetical protein